MKILWLATETTGVMTYKDDIYQIGAIYEDKEYSNIFQPFNPDTEDPNVIEALSVSGRSPEDLRNAPTNLSGFIEFQKFLKSIVNPFDRSDKVFLAGYNTQFDAQMLRTWWRKRGDKYYGSFFYPLVLDVGVIFVDYLIKSGKTLPPNFKLETVLKWAGIEVEGDLHDAMTDIIYTKKLYEWMQNNTTNENYHEV